MAQTDGEMIQNGKKLGRKVGTDWAKIEENGGAKWQKARMKINREGLSTRKEIFRRNEKRNEMNWVKYIYLVEKLQTRRRKRRTTRRKSITCETPFFSWVVKRTHKNSKDEKGEGTGPTEARKQRRGKSQPSERITKLRTRSRRAMAGVSHETG